MIIIKNQSLTAVLVKDSSRGRCGCVVDCVERGGSLLRPHCNQDVSVRTCVCVCVGILLYIVCIDGIYFCLCRDLSNNKISSLFDDSFSNMSQLTTL